MSQDRLVKQRIDVDEIASGNPAINPARFKQWRRKMARIERLGLDAEELDNPHPQGKNPPVPNGRGLYRMGNLPG